MERMNKLSKAVSKADRIYYIVIDTFLILMLLAILYPLYFIVIASISDTDAIFNGEVFLYPIGFNLKGYAALFENRMIWTGYLNTIWYTLLGTAINIAVTIPAGWAISRKELPWQEVYHHVFYCNHVFRGRVDPFLSARIRSGAFGQSAFVILPYGVSVWNMFMVNAFYSSSVPDEILEAAEVDGSGTIRTFFSIVIPLSKPIIAVMVLFYAVAHWNNYFSALIFLSEQKYFPLQLVLREILIMTESAAARLATRGLFSNRRNSQTPSNIRLLSYPRCPFWCCIRSSVNFSKRVS